MVNVTKDAISNDLFDEIYKTLEKHHLASITKEDLHSDLGEIVRFTHCNYPIECDLGMKHQDVIKNIKRLKNNFSTLSETIKAITEKYPSGYIEETEEDYDFTPKWLSFYTDQFNTDHLDSLVSGLQNIQDQGEALKEGGKKSPRFDNFGYYLKKLKSFWEKNTGKEPKVNKNHGYDTDFSKFVAAFFRYAPIKIKKGKKTLSIDVIYNEFQKIKT